MIEFFECFRAAHALGNSRDVKNGRIEEFDIKLIEERRFYVGQNLIQVLRNYSLEKKGVKNGKKGGYQRGLTSACSVGMRLRRLKIDLEEFEPSQ